MLLSMLEIAELADVKRPVVTNWRRRHSAFPDPVETRGESPLFDSRDVCDWLIATGRANRNELSIELGLRVVTALTGVMPGRDLVSALTALICLRYLDSEPLAGTSPAVLVERAVAVDPDDRFLRSEVLALPADRAGLLTAVDDLVEAAWGCAEAFERVMKVRDRLGVPELCADAVTPELASLVAGLSGATERALDGETVHVADPVAGPGDLLARVAELIGPDDVPRIAAADPDPYLARITRRRLLVRGVIPAELDVAAGTGLPESADAPDVIVTRMPYQPTEHRSTAIVLKSLEELGNELSSRRTAVVVGPADVLAGPLAPHCGEEYERAKLLLSLVEAVIRLPGGLLPYRPGYEMAVWVLRPAYSSHLRPMMLVADVSDRPLTEEVVDALVNDVVTWRHSQHWNAHTMDVCAVVNGHDLANRHGIALTERPGRSLKRIREEVPAAVTRVAELHSALTTLAAEPVPPVHADLAAIRNPVSTDSLGSLVKNGRLILIPGSRIAPSDVVTDGHYGIIGPPEVIGRSRLGARTIDRAVLADRYSRAIPTHPGDVVVTVVPEPGVFVDHNGLNVVESPARVLRVPPSERAVFTPRVLGALLVSAKAGKRAKGAVRAPHRIEDWRIPRLQGPAVLGLDGLLAQLDDRDRRAREELDILDELRQIAVAGVADGTLTLQS